MPPIISGREGNRTKIDVTVDLSGSMLEAEESILRAVNAGENVATVEAPKRFDANGEHGTKWYPSAGYRRSLTRPMELFRRSVMFINLQKAARLSAPWMTGRGLLKIDAAICKMVSHNLRTSPRYRL